MTDAIQSTLTAIKTGRTAQGKRYDYTALWAVIAWISPEAIMGLSELLNYVISGDSGFVIHDAWKNKIRLCAFVLSLWARSVVVRDKPSTS